MSSFLQAIKRCESEFDKLTKKVLENEKAITQSLNNCSKNLVGLSNSVAKTQDSVGKTTDKTNAKIGKGVQDLEKKYKALEEQIKKTFAETKVNMPKVNTGGGGSKNGGVSTTSIINSFLNGGGSGVISKLGKVGGAIGGIALAIKGVEKYLKFNDKIAEEVTDKFAEVGNRIIKAINLNPKEILDNAMDFEQIRATMNVLVKSEEKGAEVFRNATQLAKYTSFTEKDTTSMAQYVLKSNLMPTADDLKQMANLASLNPKLGAEHVGFSIFSWLNGRVTSLKQNYGISTEILQSYLKTLPDKKDFAKAFTKKGTVGDKEQAYNLLMRYVADNYGNLASTQSNTLAGRFSTFGDQLKLFGNKLVGINNEGDTIENSAYTRIGEFLGKINDDNLLTGIMKTFDDFTKSPVITEFQNTLSNFVGSVLDSLKQVITVPNLEKFTGVLNGIGTSFKNLLDKANSMNVFEKIVDAVCGAGDAFADMIKRFSDSASFETFLEGLPKLLQESLEYENAKLELAMEFKTYIPMLTAFMDKITAFLQKVSSMVNWGQEKASNIKSAVTEANDLSYGDKMQLARLTGRKGYAKDGQTVENVSDPVAITYLNEKAEEMGLTQEEVEKAINVIKSDNKDTYEINVNVAGGKIDENKLEQEMQRVFIKLIDEASSNN